MKTVTVLLIMVMMIGILAGCSKPQPTPPPEPAAAKPVPEAPPRAARAADFKLPSLPGPGTVQLSAFTGQVVMLDFWATWCPPCKAEIPALKRLYSELQPRGLEIIGLSVDEGPAVKVATLVQKFELPYPVALADESVMMSYGGIRAIPTKFIVDRMGLVRKHYQGMVPESQLRADIEALLAE